MEETLRHPKSVQNGDAAILSTKDRAMRKSNHVLLYGYGATIPLVGLAVMVTALLPPLEQVPSTVFFAAVAVSAWYGGLGAGLFATLLSMLALDYFFIPPVYALGVGLSDALRLGSFALVALLISSLDATRRRVEAALRAHNRHQEDFLAVLGHELRTPLSTCVHALGTLRVRGSDSATVEWSRQIIERQVQTMDRLISDLLDASRLRLGKVQLHKQLVDLRSLVAQAVEMTQPLLHAHRHLLELSEPSVAVWVEADPTRLQQVLVNLLSNAARYTPQGGRIWLTVEQAENQVTLRVKDNGIGILPAVLPHIFDRFAQAEQGSQGGLGIGLSLVHDLVELHGGTVTASSAGSGCGSEFTVTLPAQVKAGPREGVSRRRGN
jgi:signal transduction histidine kinase